MADCDYRARMSVLVDKEMWVDTKSFLLSARSLLDKGNVEDARRVFQKLYSSYAQANGYTDECGELVRDASESIIKILQKPEISFLTSADWWLERERISSGVPKGLGAKIASSTHWFFIHAFFPLFFVGLFVFAFLEIPEYSLFIFISFLIPFVVTLVMSLRWGSSSILVVGVLVIISILNMRKILSAFPSAPPLDTVDSYAVSLPYIAGLLFGFLIGAFLSQMYWFKNAFRHGAFSSVWVRLVPGYEKRVFPFWEVVQVDGNGQVLWRKRTHFFGTLERILDTEDGAKGFFPKLRRQKKKQSVWLHAYPALIHERGVKDTSYPVSVGVFGRFGLEWIVRSVVHGWIPLRFTDDALLNTPGLTEEKVREFFAKPYPDLSAPPGYED